MKTTLILALLSISLLSYGWPDARAGEVRERAEARGDRSAIDEGALELETLRKIQVELARARVERDAQAVDRVDDRVLAMLQVERVEGEAENGQRSDAHAGSGEDRRERRARVAMRWSELRGEYDGEALQLRVDLLDELVDLAREERRGSRREERP